MGADRNFLQDRLTVDNGESFMPSRYSLKSKNDNIVQPYRTYDLFFEITFEVIQKLGLYEDVGTPEECRIAMEQSKEPDTMRSMLGKILYCVCYNSYAPEDSEIEEIPVLDVSINGMVRIDGSEWLNPDDPEEEVFWTREEAESYLEELKRQ